MSARSGAGLDALAAALERAAAGLPGRAGAGGALVLHVDRAFTIHGAGTVVTGTLWSGSAGRGDHVELLPSGERARVRGVEVHDAIVDRAQAGQRVALNLAGAAVDRVARGDVVVGARAGAARPVVSYRLDAALDWSSPDARPANGARVAVHHGTREAAARLAELGGRYAQLRLERPLVAARGRPDRDPLARPARHARRRRRARPRAAPPRALARPARPPRAARARRARARAAAGAGHRPRRPGAAAPRSAPPRSRSRTSCAPPARSPRSTPTSTPTPSSPPCATPAARSGSAPPCTSTRRRSTRSARGCSPCSRPRARSRSRACATSSAPRASTRRRCSSASTPSA